MSYILGIIGGSGLYEIDGFEGEWHYVQSAFGEASDSVFIGNLNGTKIAFLPRHGRGHKYSPSTINYRANIDALKRVGVTDIISLSAVGSLKEELAPSDFVIIDQFIDRTFAREKSFFGTGLVAHVSMAHPTCPRLMDFANQAAQAAGAKTHMGGTYIAMEGPQFSSLAESNLYRSWGADVIGMTNMPEAKLAREAEIPYATVAMVTDYDCWNEEHGAVDVSKVIEVLHGNTAKAKQMIKNLAQMLSGLERTPSPIDTCLDTAIITQATAQDSQMKAKLFAILKRYYGKQLS